MSQKEEGQMKVHIRWMIRWDMRDVLRIENASFKSPWIEEDFLNCLRQRNCIGMVAEQGEQVVGFMLYELHPDRLRILDLAVDPSFRRSGVGTQMVKKLITKLSNHCRTKITLEVREANWTAQLFYRSCGFRAVAIERNFYEDTGEDGYVFEYVIEGCEPSHFLRSYQPTTNNRLAQYFAEQEKSAPDCS